MHIIAAIRLNSLALIDSPDNAMTHNLAISTSGGGVPTGKPGTIGTVTLRAMAYYRPLCHGSVKAG